MVTRPEPRTPTLALALLLSSLLACKMFKKGEEEELPTVPSATAAPTVTQTAPPPAEEPKPADTPLKLGDVKRFSDKEKKVEGVVKVLEADVKVFNEPDVKAPHVAELNKNIFVSRLATLDDFVLVEFPSGVGELSPGWVQAKFLSAEDSKLTEDKVKTQKEAVTLVTDKKTTTGSTSTSTSTSTSSSTTGGAQADDKANDKPKEEAKSTTSGSTSTTGGVKQIKRRRF